MQYDKDMAIGKRIKHLRKILKVSQVEFAKKIHISNGYIAELENEHRRVNERIIHLVSLTFGVNEQWLKSGEGDILIKTPEVEAEDRDSLPDEKLQRMVSLFKELPPESQDYAILQIEKLLNNGNLRSCAETEVS